MALTSHSLLVLALVLAGLAPLALALGWRGRPRGRVLGTLSRFLGVLLCQAVAGSALFFAVNDQYSFYSSWDDLLGRSAPTPGIRTAGLVAQGQGTLKVLSVAGGPTNEGDHQVLAWLPPGYDPASPTRYPVMMFLPGQPSDPVTTFSHFDFAATASREVREGRVAPFIAVFPPLMTDPPRDTECTDVPGGPQAETWLDHDVYDAVDRDLPTDGKPWTEIGWSTGAFCAAKLVLGHPRQYAAAVGLGGYYTPLTDRTTGNLFGNRPKVREENSPAWLYAHAGGMRGRRLLVVTGAQDKDSYPMTEAFLRLVGHDPGVSSVVFPTGGHNYRNYAAYLPSSLEWLFRHHG
ncbi:S-formylglutathione hydrolase FrmB [Microlunatus sagamiharensis]|uniref:S-formylglutathione hydrolase FrmB n=1 Tax=Microlunatus sagamiharensis TaxID=546874 RepID=A0A1H2MY26_9ACTN|nr:alpha/beta hydrolase-fold protein [Microlunatus sagamiharensis]SDU97994.1 S-formylglutathione hydrolase FrmB [Microlunatus sagamiharensis]